jgi:regulatory protein
MNSDDGTKKALARAYRLLAIRNRSEAEMRQSLQRAGFDAGCIDEAVSRLRDQGLINDRNFAEEWTRGRMASRPRGRRLIERELRTKGVSAEDATAATSDVDDDEAARTLAIRRAQALRDVDRQTFIRRLSNYLLARGFSRETVVRAMGHALSMRDDS